MSFNRKHKMQKKSSENRYFRCQNTRALFFVFLFFVVGNFFIVSSAFSCDTPVFRYALEFWNASQFELLVFHKGELSQEISKALDELPLKNANLRIEKVDIDKLPDTEEMRLFKRYLDGHPLPYLFLRSPILDSNDNYSPHDPESKFRHIQRRVVWESPLKPELLPYIADSPKRKEIAEKILSGTSVVFVLIDRGSSKDLIQSLSKLRKNLAQTSTEVTLSKPKREDAISKNIPLKMEFADIVVSASDPKEAVFIQCLLQSATEMKSPELRKASARLEPGKPQMITDQELFPGKEPLVVPVFGRGRALRVLKSEELNYDNVKRQCAFLSGACACIVKDDNPGIDMPFTMNWNERINPAKPKSTKGLLPSMDAFIEPAGGNQKTEDSSLRSPSANSVIGNQ